MGVRWNCFLMVYSIAISKLSYSLSWLIKLLTSTRIPAVRRLIVLSLIYLSLSMCWDCAHTVHSPASHTSIPASAYVLCVCMCVLSCWRPSTVDSQVHVQACAHNSIQLQRCKTLPWSSKLQLSTCSKLQHDNTFTCMSCPCCMLSCVFNKHVIYNWTFNCPPPILRNIFKNIFKLHLNAKCTFKWQVFSHFSRRHKTQRCSSSLYIKDNLFINAVHNIVLVWYKACFNLIYMWSASIQLHL